MKKFFKMAFASLSLSLLALSSVSVNAANPDDYTQRDGCTWDFVYGNGGSWGQVFIYNAVGECRWSTQTVEVFNTGTVKITYS